MLAKLLKYDLKGTKTNWYDLHVEKGLGKGVFWICDNVGGNLVSLRDVWMGIYRSGD